MTQKNIVSKQSAVKSQKRSAEWTVFQANLATVLGSMQEDEFLIISEKRTNRFVQFSAQGGFGMRAETTSNAYLDRSEEHSLEDHLALLALGWKQPTDSPAASTPTDDPDGSPNYFVEFPAEAPPEQIAVLSIHTLADLYGISHPGNLEYDAFDHDKIPIEHEILKIQSVRERQAKLNDPAKKLLKAVVAATGIQDLEYDEDGHLCVRYQTDLNLYILLTEDAAYIHFMAVLASDIAPNEILLTVINELNDEGKPRRFLIHDGSVIAMYMLPAKPIINKLVEKALNDFADHVMKAIPRLASALPPADGYASANPNTLH